MNAAATLSPNNNSIISIKEEEERLSSRAAVRRSTITLTTDIAKEIAPISPLVLEKSKNIAKEANELPIVETIPIVEPNKSPHSITSSPSTASSKIAVENILNFVSDKIESYSPQASKLLRSLSKSSMTAPPTNGNVTEDIDSILRKGDASSPTISKSRTSFNIDSLVEKKEELAYSPRG